MNSPTNKNTGILLLFFLAASAGFGFMKPTEISKLFVKLPIALIPQKASNWCWAATTEMVSKYFHTKNPNAPALDQCSLAIENYQGSIPRDSLRCFSDTGVTKILNKPNTPWSPPHGYTNAFYPVGACPWQVLKKKLSDSIPVIFQWKWNGILDTAKITNGSHFLLAMGYVYSQTDTTYQWVIVNDPWPVDTGRHRVISYNEYGNKAYFKLPEFKGKEFRSHGTDYYATYPKQ